jgi:hypothetical protein
MGGGAAGRDSAGLVGRCRAGGVRDGQQQRQREQDDGGGGVLAHEPSLSDLDGKAPSSLLSWSTPLAS